MDDDKFYSVFDGIKNLTGLEILNFQNNMMTDESAETMVKLISGQPHLKKLDLTNNRFGCRQSPFNKVIRRAFLIYLIFLNSILP